ncbi:Hypothetical protein FKW44_020611 [Caligus rogercresseyi]|uniref:Uncharacterized protein n=1 Tax=Caligus rogercresseyi TaxID=217165 RepID=A0A7T8GXH2_CALRO|nr:Hypothetical protein FKW44_020611 [Caligus rogercresseyi]
MIPFPISPNQHPQKKLREVLDPGGESCDKRKSPQASPREPHKALEGEEDRQKIDSEDFSSTSSSLSAY